MSKKLGKEARRQTPKNNAHEYRTEPHFPWIPEALYTYDAIHIHLRCWYPSTESHGNRPSWVYAVRPINVLHFLALHRKLLPGIGILTYENHPWPYRLTGRLMHGKSNLALYMMAVSVA